MKVNYTVRQEREIEINPGDMIRYYVDKNTNQYNLGVVLRITQTEHRTYVVVRWEDSSVSWLPLSSYGDTWVL